MIAAKGTAEPCCYFVSGRYATDVEAAHAFDRQVRGLLVAQKPSHPSAQSDSARLAALMRDGARTLQARMIGRPTNFDSADALDDDATETVADDGALEHRLSVPSLLLERRWVLPSIAWLSL